MVHVYKFKVTHTTTNTNGVERRRSTAGYYGKNILVQLVVGFSTTRFPSGSPARTLGMKMLGIKVVRDQ